MKRHRRQRFAQRRWKSAAAIALLGPMVAALSACASSSDGARARETGHLTRLSICNSGLGGVQAVAVYAQDNGVFSRYGLDVDITLVSGGSRAVPAMTSGSVPLCLMAGVPVANAVLAGADIAVVGTLVDTYTYALVAGQDIRTPADLKGRAVAISAPGSASSTAMGIALERLGLRRAGDVSMVAIGSHRQRLAALEAGYVAAALLDYPEVHLALARGFKTMLDMAPLALPTLHTCIAVNRAFLREHRPTVLRFVQAISHAVFAIKRDRPGALAALGKYTQLDPKGHAAALEKTYEVVQKGQLKDIPYASDAGMAAVLAEAARNHPGARVPRPDELADHSLVADLERSGFFEKLEWAR
jgi:NitT/TauT family transport system substrate-binding protein